MSEEPRLQKKKGVKGVREEIMLVSKPEKVRKCTYTSSDKQIKTIPFVMK